MGINDDEGARPNGPRQSVQSGTAVARKGEASPDRARAAGRLMASERSGMDAAEAEREFASRFKGGDYGRALAAAQRALGALPSAQSARWHKLAAAAAVMLREFEVAYANYGLAKGREPFTADDLYNFGLCCDELGRHDEAVSLYKRSLKLNPANPRAHNNLGKTLNNMGRYREAEAHLRQALALEPDRAWTELNLAISLLSRGEWRSGWKYFEVRLPAFKTIPPMPYPRWDGRPRRDRILLLRSEQGLGDTIQFCRFASLLGGLGVPVILQAPPTLVALLRTAKNLLQVIRWDSHLRSEKSPIEWAPLMSVPGIMGVMPDTVPSPPSYLSAEPDRVARWRSWLPADGFRIGVAWHGNPQADRQNRRSFPLALCRGMASIPGVRLVSLQKGAGVEQIGQVSFRDRLIVPPPDFDAGDQAFLDSAAMMTSLDLVLSADTAVAHLAGALGRPTFLALQRWPEWRWLLDRDDTPWYPTLRLFRQSAPGEWESVFVRMTAEVEALARQGRPPS